MADAPDLGSGVLRRVGSSPTSRTIITDTILRCLYFGILATRIGNSLVSKSKKNQTEKFHSATVDDIQYSRILVVDDEKLVREFLFDALEAENYTVELAEDCNEEIEKLSTMTFDLILSDINLPGMSGIDLLQFCKKKYQATEIILITGSPGLDGAVQAVKNGAFDYLSKPITPTKLYEKVKAALMHAKTISNPLLQTGDEIPETGYSIIRTLGSGNMGVVLLVEKDKKYYAMKILRRETPGPIPEMKTQRFIREAEILSKIDHPNVVKIFEYGISDNDNVPYFVMDFIPGRPLNYYMMNNSFTTDEKVSIIRQISSALDIVHEFGILHRDVKPGNVLITDDKTAILTDFGIARIVDSNLTITRELLGSPAYMAPEAFNSSLKKDQRSDIFSLGIIAYELLTGVKPFYGETIGEIMDAINNKHPVEPIKINPNLQTYLQDILAKMLAKKPEDRFESTSEIIRAIDHESGKSTHKEGITARLLRTLLLNKPTWK